MESLLREQYLQDSCQNFEAQPDNFKKRVEEDFEKQYNGDLDYIDYFGEPMIYSSREAKFYIYRDGKLEKTGFKSENDLERINFDEFNNRFNNIGEKLQEDFKEKADIENTLQMILSPQDLEKWFISLLDSYNEEDKKEILKALELCKEKHKGQLRDEGTDYYSHPVFVAIKGIEYNLGKNEIISLLLHDTIEDTDLSYDDLVELFGEKVANNVLGLSKKSSGEKIISKEDYYNKISEDEILAVLKGLDRLANLFSLNFATKEKQERYLQETKEVILPIVKKYNQELEQEIQKLIGYIKNSDYNLPPEVSGRLEDLKRINQIKEEIKH